MPPATFPSADNKGFTLVAPVAKRGLRNTLCTAPQAGIPWRRPFCLTPRKAAGGTPAPRRSFPILRIDSEKINLQQTDRGASIHTTSRAVY